MDKTILKKNENFLKSRDALAEIEKNIFEIEQMQSRSQERQIALMEALVKAKNQISLVFEAVSGARDLENPEELDGVAGFLVLAVKFQGEAESVLSVIAKFQNKILNLTQKIEFLANQITHNLTLLKDAVGANWPFSAALLAQDIQKQAEDLIFQIEFGKVEGVAGVVGKAKKDTLSIGGAVDKIKRVAVADKYLAKIDAISKIEEAQVDQTLASQSGQTFDQQQAQCFQMARRMRQKIGDLNRAFSGL